MQNNRLETSTGVRGGESDKKDMYKGIHEKRDSEMRNIKPGNVKDNSEKIKSVREIINIETRNINENGDDDDKMKIQKRRAGDVLLIMSTENKRKRKKVNL